MKTMDIVLREVPRIGLGSTPEDLAALQALIDQAHSGQIQTDQADNAEAALRSITATLNASGTPATTTSSNSTMTVGAAILIGLGGGILLGSIAILTLEQKPQPRRQGAR